MSEREMFEASFGRPQNYFKLSAERQWDIDKDLGILDWVGTGLTDEDKNRMIEYYGFSKKSTRRSTPNFQK